MSDDWKKHFSDATTALTAAANIQLSCLKMLIGIKKLKKKEAHVLLDMIAEHEDFKDDVFAQRLIKSYKDGIDGKLAPITPDMTNVILFPKKKKK